MKKLLKFLIGVLCVSSVGIAFEILFCLGSTIVSLITGETTGIFMLVVVTILGIVVLYKVICFLIEEEAISSKDKRRSRQKQNRRVNSYY